MANLRPFLKYCTTGATVSSHRSVSQYITNQATHQTKSIVANNSGFSSKIIKNFRRKSADVCRPITTIRSISASSAALQESKPSSSADLVEVTFITEDGSRHTAKGNVGDSLLDVVVNKDLPLDGYGACEGTLACSTCHVILSQGDFDKLPDKPSDEELDMLDLAYGLTDTSRLGCQVALSKELNGMELKVPSGVFDARQT